MLTTTVEPFAASVSQTIREIAEQARTNHYSNQTQQDARCAQLEGWGERLALEREAIYTLVELQQARGLGSDRYQPTKRERVFLARQTVARSFGIDDLDVRLIRSNSILSEGPCGSYEEFLGRLLSQAAMGVLDHANEIARTVPGLNARIDKLTAKLERAEADPARLQKSNGDLLSKNAKLRHEITRLHKRIKWFEDFLDIEPPPEPEPPVEVEAERHSKLDLDGDRLPEKIFRTTNKDGTTHYEFKVKAKWSPAHYATLAECVEALANFERNAS